MSSVDGLPRSSGPPAHGTLAGFPRVTTTWGRIVRLTVVGGLAFWVANLAISLTVWPGSATAVAILTPQPNDGDFTNQFELASALVGMANE